MCIYIYPYIYTPAYVIYNNNNVYNVIERERKKQVGGRE
jgi:hypothetical protein